MEKRWIVHELPDEQEVIRLSKELNITTNLATILLQRGIKTFDEAKKLLSTHRSNICMILF